MHLSHTILNAASQYFHDYGYRKTNMADIAKQANMSVGNLYRHFKNKEALLIACVEKTLETKFEMGMQAGQACDNSEDALKAFLIARLNYSHAQLCNTRHLYDLIEIVHQKHQNILDRYEQKTIQSIAQMLAQGFQDGSFKAMDYEQTAYDIYQSMMRYNHPLALKNNPLELLSNDLSRLIDLLYKGLKA